MDLREKMAMLRAQQQSEEPQFVAAPTKPTNKEWPGKKAEAAPEVVEVEVDEPKCENTKPSLMDAAAEKKLLLKISKQLKEITSDKFKEEIADLVVKKMNEDLKNA